ncbi:major facilitator superfamily domain-containing protein, partial [Filobasidium floriforme]|uniref:major facilitator superfamily domain-containing protein n=1 Tax=Filobasidium floriforme TaxID=5210 RepID=UPI001E8E3CEF
LNIAWKYKWLALLCVCAFPLGQNWTDSALGPLKATLRTELSIDNTQYDLANRAGAIINSFWPIIGGIMLDFYGVNIVTLACTSLICAGAVVAALAANTGIWRMLVGGHIMMGFGTAVLDSAQHKLFYHWFGVSGLALAFGLESAVARTVKLVSGMTTIPIKNNTGWYGWSFWIPAALCAFSLIVNIVYVLWERTVVPKRYRLTGTRAAAIAKTQRRPDFKALLALPWAFWMLPMTQILQSEAAGAFGNSATDLITMRGYEEDVAAFTANAQNILPIVLTPFIGLAVDRWGFRFHLTALAPLLWITACALIGWSDVHPLLSVVFASFAGMINSFPFQVTIPLLVRDQSKLGTAFGVWRSFNNSGSTIMSIAYGRMQDETEDGGYANVLKTGIAFKAWAFCLGLNYIYMDRRYLGKGMSMGEKQRTKLEEELMETDPDHPLVARPVSKRVTWTALVELTCMVIVAWTLFIYYVL